MSPSDSCRRSELNQPTCSTVAKLELRASLPDAVGDQFGLVAVDERFGQRIVVDVADRADRGQDAVIVERLV